MACKGSWHDPPMMGFVESLVNARVMKSPVNPIDKQVCEANEEGKL